MNSSARRNSNNEAAIDKAIEEACGMVAPTWPLDRFIAINPHWARIAEHFEAVSDQLARFADSCLWMPPDFYKTAWREKRIVRRDLTDAMAECGTALSEGDLIAALESTGCSTPAINLLSDAADALRGPSYGPTWSETITDQISRFCAAYFDRNQSDWAMPRRRGLYATWRHTTARDHGVARLFNENPIAACLDELPESPNEMIRFALHRLHIETDRIDEFLQVALFRIGGWAAWCAYLRWEARLSGSDDDTLVDLLAVRIAWEYILACNIQEVESVWRRWEQDWTLARNAVNPACSRALAVWQRALEIAYQRPLAESLARTWDRAASTVPSVQAVFCIDVRSEVLRRALETTLPSIQTLGFAGFFGLPLRYAPLGSDTTIPQLPGLLSPSLEVTDSSGDLALDRDLAARRRKRLQARLAWHTFRRLPASAFSLVESFGIGYAVKLFRRTLHRTMFGDNPLHAGLLETETGQLRPRLGLEGPDNLIQRAKLAERVLRAMSLTESFAPLVLLVGHTGQSANNPHAAGLDCGACGGQSGEVNARTLAALLNETSVRQELAKRQIDIRGSTHFLGAVHNTTTDEVTFYDCSDVPPRLRPALENLKRDMAMAGQHARAERAATLGLSHYAHRPRRLLKALRQRAVDWSQTRPEWGLANNAAFIVAPRYRTRDLNLRGRAFLHDYDWRCDQDGDVLENIMTGPMIVTHWINMQYYASTVDNQRFGSGNKILHNVVGGRIGVFEGNTGDLRIGLPLQSVHDGKRWIHTPLRLSVFVDAPRKYIDAVIASHETVRHLIENRWLHLFRLTTPGVELYSGGRWVPGVFSAESPALCEPQ